MYSHINNLIARSMPIGHVTWPFCSAHGTFIKMAYYDPIFLANSCCTATQLYPMLHYGGQALMHGRRSTGRHFRVCFWRLSSFFCDRAETLVALLITLAIVLAFDHWPGRVIGDYFTLECKASTIYKTGKVSPIHMTPPNSPYMIRTGGYISTCTYTYRDLDPSSFVLDPTPRIWPYPCRLATPT